MDYYSTLGINKSASDDEIKKAYRKLAMKYHPDKNKNDKTSEVKFKEINEAYEVLKDSQKRAAYDRYGHDGYKKSASSSAGNSGGRGGFDDFGFGGSAFSDIFESMFGNMGADGHERVDMRGADLRYDVQVTLEEAFIGKDITLNLRTYILCDACFGSGAEGGAKPRTCPSCRGSGRQRFSQGFFTVEKTCSACNGSGQIIEKACKYCKGAGRVSKVKTLNVTIPSGIENGVKMRLTGEGEAGLRGGSVGDLYVFISIKPHAIFTRDGNNLNCDIPVSMITATIGGEVEVPTIDGRKALLKIPSGTQSGQILKLKGKGMKIVRSSIRGDMLVRIKVETPTNLTDRQIELLLQFEQEAPVHPQSDGFWGKIKDFWQEIKE